MARAGQAPATRAPYPGAGLPSPHAAAAGLLLIEEEEQEQVGRT